MIRPALNWAAIDADPRFQELHRKKMAFLWGLMIFSVIYYFLLPDRGRLFPGALQDQGLGPGERGHPVRALPVRRRLGDRGHLLPGAPTASSTPWPRRSFDRRRQDRSLTCTSQSTNPGCSRPRSPRSSAAAWPTQRGRGGRPVQMDDLRGVRRHHRHHHGDHLLGGAAHPLHLRVLCRRPLGDRHAERLGDRRRLPVRRVLPRHRRTDLALRLRRLHVLGGLARRLHHRAAGHRRAMPQHRQVHARRHPGLPQPSRRQPRPSRRCPPSPSRPST